MPARRAERPLRGKIRLAGLRENDEQPVLSVWALGPGGEVIERADANEKGRFQLSSGAMKSARRVVVGARAPDREGVPKRSSKTYKPGKFATMIEEGAIFRLPRRRWINWLRRTRCVSGSVRRCRFGWTLSSRILEAVRPSLSKATLRAELADATALSASAVAISRRPGAVDLVATDRLRSPALRTRVAVDPVIAYPIQPWLPIRCAPVCDGVVEVWKRVCCRKPFVIYDPRLPELEEILVDLIPRPPEELDPPVPWPPRPQPDPIPDILGPLPRPGAADAFEGRVSPELAETASKAVLRSGALDEMALNARVDLEAIRTLPAKQVAEYVNARPYLWWRWDCGDPVRVAKGTIDEGEFTICWKEPLVLLRAGCKEEFAYIVRQHVGGATIKIYDGVAAGQWFGQDDDPTLTSYHPLAQGCRHNDFPGGEGAFALLQDIGLAGAHVLHTPPADSWDGVAGPLAFNHGLAFPEANPAAAKGKYLNRNWGGLLRLRYHFSEPLKGAGAKYYRVSVSKSNGAGNPTGSRSYLAPSAWRYYEVAGTDILVKNVALGPHSVGGEDDLYEIPYDADRDWQSGQYHALLSTEGFDDGRHLLTLELFDAAGKMLRPAGTPNPGGSKTAPFTFRRWEVPTGPTLNVPFAALTHLFWWDNRKAVADIVDLRKNGAPNTAECQFLEGAAGSKFSVGYRAYHPQPQFLLDHRVWWRRGLGSTTGVLTSPHPNPENVGVPPGGAHQSGEDNFGPVGSDPGMLGSHSKCSFTVNLHANVKTFNGVGTINSLDAWDQAAFALEIGS